MCLPAPYQVGKELFRSNSMNTDAEGDDTPDPEVGIWGWEDGKNINLPLRELTPFEKLQARLQEDAERQRKERWRRVREMEEKSSSDFNRYLIDTYNEARRKEK